ncbi:MAG: NYN domain-containing protein [Clostridia bacterium]|nr:NYN domain-containing protein [Clostridia bacterium]
MEKDKKIAVLIDADNVSDKYIKFIMDEISNHGTPTYKRIYGDWTKPNVGSWKGVLLNNSITPVQQYGYTTGKNATDAAMIIEAMDILYSNNVDGFCIVSSDSDFTRLATRLREAGMYVIGMGEKKTPKPFIAACEIFKYLEVLAESPIEEAKEVEKKGTKKEDIKKEGITSKGDLINSIKMIVRDNSDEDGWINLGEAGSRLVKRHPDFDTRNYGHSKLYQLINSLKQFEMEARKIPTNPGGTNYYIKNKEVKD